MAFQRVPNTIEVVVHGLLNGQSCVNTFYFKAGHTPTAEDCEAAASAMDVGWDDQVLPLLSNEYTYSFVSARSLDSEFAPYAENDDHTGVGAVGTTAIANNVALSIKRRSAVTGRGARGRVFIGGLPFSEYSPTTQTMSPTFVAAITTALNTISSELAGIDLPEVIVHRVAAGIPLPEAIVFTVVEYVVVNAVIDSMRRRLPGRGS